MWNGINKVVVLMFFVGFFNISLIRLQVSGYYDRYNSIYFNSDILANTNLRHVCSFTGHQY